VVSQIPTCYNYHERRNIERVVKEKALKRKLSSYLWSYLIGLAIVIGITLLGELIKIFSIFDPTSMDMLYVLGVTISAFYLGIGPSLMVSFLSVLTFDFFFIPPISTFTIASPQDIINVLILWVVCIVISCLSPRMRA
jgi:two-component system sensor histidine kinase KdpD